MTKLPTFTAVKKRLRYLLLDFYSFRRSVERRFTTWWEKLPGWLAIPFGLVFGIPAVIIWFVGINLVFLLIFSAIILVPVFLFGVIAWLSERYLAPLVGVDNFDFSSYALGTVVGSAVVWLWFAYREANRDEEQPDNQLD